MQDETMTPETLPRVTYFNIAEDFLSLIHI